ncbi:cytochrome c [soil metagenome]
MTKTMRILLACLPFVALQGCQQKMADQPAPRAYDESPLFPHKQSARPLEAGVVYRGQKPDSDPLVTGLTEKGRKVKVGDWSGAKAYDEKSVVPPAGAPNDLENYVKEFPFAISEADLKRGQQRYNVYCALCHGAAGDAMGKIPERGYLRPPSYHTDPEGKAKDWSTPGQPSSEIAQGYSRGFNRFGIKVSLKDVPVGYIFQVITQGYGGMPDHASQIPVEDRWKITAYIRALQLSQGATAGELPADAKKALDGGKKPADDHKH